MRCNVDEFGQGGNVTESCASIGARNQHRALQGEKFLKEDNVNHPKHYTSHPSGIECIDVVEHMPFNIGNAIKYLWRAGLKDPDWKVDLEKAMWYINREIKRRET